MHSENNQKIDSSFRSLESKQSFVIGLLEKCPMRLSIESCPAYHLRKLPTSEKIELIMSLEERKLVEIINHHMNCMGDTPSNDTFQ